jgi:2-polyprenyl-3-methyl-5-hydroxy-6-metoxy-1,4-benzoquinol methylase
MLSARREQARWLPLSRRSDALELLDLGRVTGAELRANLDDLARLNRLPGGRGDSLRAVTALVGATREATILDVGTGACDLPLAFASRGWRVLALDADPAVVAVARTRTAGADGIRVVEGDATALPFGDASVDVAHASLLAHHLDPDAAIRAFGEMARVSRRGIVINDLRRGVVPLLATAFAVAVLGRCRATRHDGLLSVRRAYTPTELDTLLAAAGLRVVHRSAPWMPRVTVAAVRRSAP